VALADISFLLRVVNSLQFRHIGFAEADHESGAVSALAMVSFGGTQAVLKISVTNQSSEATNFRLEGKLVGPWVEELRRLSDAALVTSEAVSLDLEKVWFVDSQGIALLRDLASKQVAQINCSQFISQQLKERTYDERNG
jgi:ABC-type transporter Mla MlaB component